MIELLIAMLLGLIISGGIIQLLVSTQVTQGLNRSLSSLQEDGRFIISRFKSDVINAGFYDLFSPNLSQLVDTVEESAFLTTRPIILPGDFAGDMALGSTQGAAGANDTLVFAYQGNRDCRGYTLGYDGTQEFFVVNKYFVSGNALKCVGYDGRVLRGQKAADGTNNNAAFTLLENVESFQVLYGVNFPVNNSYTGSASSYVTAANLPAALAADGEVVTVRLAILLEGDGEVSVTDTPSFKLLNEDPVTPSGTNLYKQFDTTILLRNPLNRITRGM